MKWLIGEYFRRHISCLFIVLYRFNVGVAFKDKFNEFLLWALSINLVKLRNCCFNELSVASEL